MGRSDCFSNESLAQPVLCRFPFRLESSRSDWWAPFSRCRREDLAIPKMRLSHFSRQFPQSESKRKQLKMKENRICPVWQPPCDIGRRVLTPTPIRKGGERHGGNTKVDQGSVEFQ